MAIAVIIYLFNQGKIQDQLVRSITQTLKKEYDLDMSINSSKYTIKDGIELNDILILDHKKDTLIFLKKLETNLNSYPKLIDNEYQFSKIFLDGLFLNIKKYEGKERTNLQYFIDSMGFSKNSTLDNTLINISNFELSDSKISYMGSEEFFDVLSLKSSNLEIFKNKINVSNISSKLKYDSQEILFESDTFIMANSNLFIDNYLISSDFGNSSGSLAYKDSIGLKSKIIKSDLKIDNFNLNKLKFKTNLNSLSNFSSEVSISGSLDSLNVKAIITNSSNSKLYSDFTLFNFFSKDDFYSKGSIKSNQFKISSISSMINKSPNLLNEVQDNDISFDLSTDLKGKKWNIFGIVSTQFGDFKINFFDNTQNTHNTLVVDKFDPSLLNHSLPSGYFSGDLKYKFEKDSYEWYITSAHYDIPNFSKININAKGKDNLKKGNISFNLSDGLDVYDSSLEYDFSSEVKLLSSIINLKSFNLSSINPNLGGGKAILSGVFKAKIEGNSIDNSSIIMTVQDIKLDHKNGTLNSSDFYVNSKLSQGNRIFSIINSPWFFGEATGNFAISELSALINNAFSETFPLISKKPITSTQELNFDFTLSKDLVNVLNSEILSTENLNLLGHLSSKEFKSYLDIEIPFFQYQDFFAQGLRININNKSLDKDSKLEVDKLVYKKDAIGKFIFGSKRMDNKLLVKTKLESLTDTGNSFDLNFLVNRTSNYEGEINLKQSNIRINNNDWNLDVKNVKPLFYNSLKSVLSVPEVGFESNNSKIKMSGFYDDSKNFKLDLILKYVNFNQLIKQKNTFSTDGYFDMHFNMKRSVNENKLNCELISEQIQINNKIIGNLELFINGNTQTNSYSINSELFNKEKNIVADGNLIYNKDETKLDLTLLFNNFDISFLSPLGKKSISNIRGLANGEVNIWGDLNNLNNTGVLKLNKSGFTLPYLNTDYNLVDNTILNLSSTNFNILPTSLFDSTYKTSTSLSGKFSHTSFKEWNMDLYFEPKGLLLLNKKETPEVLFFGKGFFSGDIKMEGPTKNPKLFLTGVTASGTSIKIPWKDTKEITDTSFITFVDKDSDSNSNIYLNNNRNFENEIRGLEIFFELDINNDAEVEIVIDQSSGSFINGRGNGKLLMETNTNGKFDMWGDFTTTNGIYNFKNIGLLDKKFNLEQGGTIVWEGDPLGANMDLKATYEVPGGANPAILLDNPSFNKKIPTEVGIHLQGNLLKPDNPTFEILFPNTSGTVISEINYRLSDPQRSQLQAISLLSQGIFINDVSLSMQGITNNLYEKASDIFSSILGNDDEKLKVGINYLQGDKNSELDIFTEDRLGLTLSTQVSDKILINGKIGVPVGGVNETLIVGDVQIDFILNNDGTLRAKVFNRENEFRYIGDELGYTQGMGLSYNVDFDSFKELINKIITDAR